MVCAAKAHGCTGKGSHLGVRLDACERQADGSFSFPQEACAYYCNQDCMKKEGATDVRTVNRQLYGTVPCKEAGCDEKFMDRLSMHQHARRAHPKPKDPDQRLAANVVTNVTKMATHFAKMNARIAESNAKANDKANDKIAKMADNVAQVEKERMAVHADQMRAIANTAAEMLAKAAGRIKESELNPKDRSEQGAGFPGRVRFDNRGTAEETEVQRASDELDAQAQASAGAFAPGVDKIGQQFIICSTCGVFAVALAHAPSNCGDGMLAACWSVCLDPLTL